MRKGTFLVGTVVALISDRHADRPMTVENHNSTGTVDVVWFDRNNQLQRDIVLEELLYIVEDYD